MAFIGAKPTNVPLTSADLEDSIITSAKISDGTITPTDMDLSGTYAFTGTVTGAGGNMKPSFFAYLGGSGGQAVSDNTVTKVQCNTEVLDTDNCYDSSTNYRFTPNVAGKYFLYGSIQTETGTNSDLNDSYFYFKKNGSANILESVNIYANGFGRQDIITGSIVVDANGSSDYFEMYGRINCEDNSGMLFESDSQWARATHFGAFKIIE
nr:complement C1q protein [uncultured Mediterranean phage uvMED]